MKFSWLDAFVWLVFVIMPVGIVAYAVITSTWSALWFLVIPLIILMAG